MALDILIPTLVFFGLMAVGARVAAAMAVGGAVGLLITVGWTPSVSTVEAIVRNQATSMTLVAIPLFLLMAEFANESGIISRLFRVAQLLLGRVRAGVAYATVLASAGVAALSGSSVAATGLLGRVAVPEMTRLGYSPTLALGITATAGTIAVMIPPSIALILYGIITQTSIGALLLGGLGPGAATALGYFGVVALWARVRPQDVPAKSLALEPVGAAQGESKAVPTRSRTRRGSEHVLQVVPFILVVFTVLVVIYSGAATVTEAAAFGALATLVAWALLARRRGSPESDTTATSVDRIMISPARILQAARRATGTTVMIMALVIAAQLLGAWLTRSGVTRALTTWLSELGLPNLVMLILISIVLVVLGMFLSPIEILVLTLPLLFPLVTGAMGYHPLWFGIWMVKLLEIGLVSPPFGINAFVVTAAAGSKYRVEDTFRGVVPFYLADLVVLVLILLIPELVTWAEDVV